MSEWMANVQDITTGERRRDYGHPLTNFLRICLLWSVELERPISPRRFVSMMVLMKRARGMNVYKEDNEIDILGYEATYEMCIQRCKELGIDIEVFDDPRHGVRYMWEAFILSRKADEDDRP